MCGVLRVWFWKVCGALRVCLLEIERCVARLTFGTYVVRCASDFEKDLVRCASDFWQMIGALRVRFRKVVGALRACFSKNYSICTGLELYSFHSDYSMSKTVKQKHMTKSLGESWRQDILRQDMYTRQMSWCTQDFQLQLQFQLQLPLQLEFLPVATDHIVSPIKGVLFFPVQTAAGISRFLLTCLWCVFIAGRKGHPSTVVWKYTQKYTHTCGNQIKLLKFEAKHMKLKEIHYKQWKSIKIDINYTWKSLNITSNHMEIIWKSKKINWKSIGINGNRRKTHENQRKPTCLIPSHPTFGIQAKSYFDRPICLHKFL